MRQVAAVETTTLPEGTVLMLERVRGLTAPTKTKPLGSETGFRTELTAHTKETQLRMTIADVSPNSLRPMLGMIVRQLQLERERITAELAARGMTKVAAVKEPVSFRDFAVNMMAAGMFGAQPVLQGDGPQVVPTPGVPAVPDMEQGAAV